MFRHTGTPLAAPPSESIRTGQTGWKATSKSITKSLKAAQCLIMLSKAGPAKSSSLQLPTPRNILERARHAETSQNRRSIDGL